MAEPQLTITADGQEVQGDDLTLAGQVAGLADDRVLAELLRLAPFATVAAKAVFPYGLAKDIGATVQPSGNADGKCRVMPFRAIVGSVDTVADIGALANWRDIRSGIYAVTDDNATLGHLITFAANTSGSLNRWDLVYAALARDANGPSVTRYNKPASGGAVIPTSIPQYLTQAITIGVVTGTASSTPAFPSLPSDAAGTYYIPLAYVAIPHGFGATSTIPGIGIYDAAPVLPQARESGVASLRVADQSNAPGGTVFIAPNFVPQATWIHRSPAFVPPSMVGSEEIFIAMDLSDNSSSTNWSHNTGSIVDQSCDWSKRMFTFVAVADSGSTHQFAWDRAAVSATVIPGVNQVAYVGVGQSFQQDASALGAPAGGVVCSLNSSNTPQLNASSHVILYVDYSTTGNPLRVYATTSPMPLCRLVIWVRATAPFGNY